MKSHLRPVRYVCCHRKGSFRYLVPFFLAKVGRLVAMPSTSRILPISEKFCKAKAFSFGTGHKTKSKFYPKFLGEGYSLASLFQLTQPITRKLTTVQTNTEGDGI